MRTILSVIFAVAMVPALAAPGANAPKVNGFGTPQYRWAMMEAEFAAALATVGNPIVGKETYEICVGCHLPSGAGSADGRYPQLAGQHASVLIKQMTDIRKGLRDNPVMYPYAVQLKYAQDLSDVAAYLASLCIPVAHGRYEGSDAVMKVASGRELYERQCATCHGVNGEGDKTRFYPVIAGQHYNYLLRQMTEIRDGLRKNANPDMVKLIKQYTNEQLLAISAYQASLSMRGAMCTARGVVPPDSKQ